MAWGQYHETQALDSTLFKIDFISPAHLQPVSLAANTTSRACASRQKGGWDCRWKVCFVLTNHRVGVRSTPRDQTMYAEPTLQTASKEGIKKEW